MLYNILAKKNLFFLSKNDTEKDIIHGTIIFLIKSIV